MCSARPFVRKTVCPPLPMRWLALHCASEGCSGGPSRSSPQEDEPWRIIDKHLSESGEPTDQPPTCGAKSREGISLSAMIRAFSASARRRRPVGPSITSSRLGSRARTPGLSRALSQRLHLSFPETELEASEAGGNSPRGRALPISGFVKTISPKQKARQCCTYEKETPLKPKPTKPMRWTRRQ